MNVAVLASGTGTNLQALLDRVHRTEGIEIVAVASDKPDARALERAAQLGGKRLSDPIELPDGYGRIAMFTDPDGNRVGLWA